MGNGVKGLQAQTEERDMSRYKSDGRIAWICNGAQVPVAAGPRVLERIRSNFKLRTARYAVLAPKYPWRPGDSTSS